MPTALSVVRSFFPKVQKVVDASHPLRIEVTDKDASSKGNKKHDSCAMAVACKRKFHLDGVIISRSMAYLVKGNKARRFQLPQSVAREIVSFDRGAGFEPGEYRLNPVQESAKLLGKRWGGNGKPTKHRNRNAPKRFHHRTGGVRSSLSGGAK